ncbi:hypothetical protein RN001_005686 [Aquatica leii]|uniref:Regulatory protein zeste n=1 Tax=Aquatica leii TaxID=1421715 RepID=A0AAN7Q1M1_9COLE|nr:hypothetical protein RN001_005686 [Aquatica leii]
MKYDFQKKLNGKVNIIDVKARCGKMNASQKSALIQSVQLNSQLILVKFTTTFTHKKAQQLWMHISETLNAIPGGRKDWKQWRKTWQDIHTKAKSKNTKLKQDHDRTGGGRPNDEILTEDDDKILSLMSPVEIIGGDNVTESHAAFVDNLDIENAEIIFEPAASTSNITEENKCDIKPQVSSGDALPSANLNKRRKTRAATQKLTESVIAAQRLAEVISRKTRVKENCYNKKLEVLVKQANSFERIAVALENLRR